MANRSNNSVRRVWMQDDKVVRWWWAEVVREDVSNDNEDFASWCARWTEMADMMASKNWRAQEMAMREMVAVARANNRPRSV